MDESEAVRVAAGLSDDDASARRADAALGEALVWVVQGYLARVSSEHDVDLFFETYGRPPRDESSWSKAIIAGLNFRKDIPDDDRQAVLEESRQRADNRLAGR